MMKILRKISLLVVALALLFAFSACNETFSFASSIVDNTVVTDAQYDFTASASYGSRSCALEVSCNGILLTGEEGSYTASLNKGENEIVLSASSGNRSDMRSYTVVYRNKFVFSDNLDAASIKDGVLRFSASATFNNEPCALAVSCNGETATKEGDTFCVRLTSGGENIVELTARRGEYSERKEWRVHYDGFTIVTDLTDRETGLSEIDFRAAALYGDDSCDLIVRVNGTKLDPVGGARYSLAMAQGGVYEVELTALRENMSETKTYTIRYTDAPPEFELLTVRDGGTFRGSLYSFDVIARDGLGKKLSYRDYSFAADLDPDDGREEFVPLKTEVRKVWDDDTKTSFSLSFKSGAFADRLGKPFLFRVTATAFEKSVSETFELTYIGADSDGKIGEVVFSLEGFTIGCGYFIEPCFVPIYEGVPFSVTLTDLIEEHGWEYGYTGTTEASFYLSSVTGMDLAGNCVPDSLQEVMNAKGYEFKTTSLSRFARLGEFDYTSGSGWMYSVNGSFPNFGFSNCFPQDGDAVRVHFTLALGNDIGGGYAVGNGSAGFLEKFANYEPLMKLLAEIRAQEFYGKGSEAYDAAIDAVAVWNASQSLLDAQIENLKTFYGIEV